MNAVVVSEFAPVAVLVLMLVVEELLEAMIEETEDETGGGSLEISVVMTIETEVSSQMVTWLDTHLAS